MTADVTSDTQLAILTHEVAALRTDIHDLNGSICKRLDDHECRIRGNERAVTQMQENQKLTTGLLAGLQLIVGGIAAWIGSKI